MREGRPRGIKGLIAGALLSLGTPHMEARANTPDTRQPSAVLPAGNDLAPGFQPDTSGASITPAEERQKYLDSKTETEQKLIIQADIEPIKVIEFLNGGLFYPPEILKLAVNNTLRTQPGELFRLKRYFADTDYAETALRAAARKDPVSFFNELDTLLDLPYFLNLTEIATVFDPGKLIEVLARNNDTAKKLRSLLETSTQLAMRATLDLADNTQIPLDEKIKMAALLPEAINNTTKAWDWTATKKLAHNESAYWHHLLEFQKASGNASSASKTRERVFTTIAATKASPYNNAFHEDARFDAAEKMSVEELYIVMANSADLMFTSTFKGLYKVLTKKMNAGHIDGAALLDTFGVRPRLTFLQKASHFGELDSFFTTIKSKTDQSRFIMELIQNENFFVRDSSLESVAALADVFYNINDATLFSPELLGALEAKYERLLELHPAEAVYYGIMASVWYTKKHINNPWLKKMATEYPLPDFSTMDRGALFVNDPNTHVPTLVEQYVFPKDRQDLYPGDHDSARTFKKFVESYQKSGWVIKEYPDYVKITSTGEYPNQQKIEIYANRPEQEENGKLLIQTEFQYRNISPKIIVGRSHVKYAPKIIEQHVNPNVQAVFLLNCNAFKVTLPVAQKTNPRTYFMAPKGVGQQAINEPLLADFNNALLEGTGTFNVKAWWQKEQQTLAAGHPNVREYVGPEDNMIMVLHRAAQMHDSRNASSHAKHELPKVFDELALAQTTR